MRDENICKAIVKVEKDENGIDMSLIEAQRFFNSLHEDQKAREVWYLYTMGYLEI